jgi:hypothetical protein
MVETRITPHLEQAACQVQHAGQSRLYRCHPMRGPVIQAAAICIGWLFDTHPKWIFPAGWRRP